MGMGVAMAMAFGGGRQGAILSLPRAFVWSCEFLESYVLAEDTYIYLVHVSRGMKFGIGGKKGGGAGGPLY